MLHIGRNMLPIGGLVFMMNQKEKNILFLLDVIELILSIVAIIIFTLIFRLETSFIRYLFLIGDCYVIYSFSKTLSSLETKIEKHIIMKKQNNTDANCVKELSI